MCLRSFTALKKPFLILWPLEQSSITFVIFLKRLALLYSSSTVHNYSDVFNIFLISQETFLNNDYESVMHSMSLMRNILLVPEPFDVVDEDSVVATVQPCNSRPMLNLDPRHRYLVYESQHNRILWNLFAMGLDDLLIKLYTVCPENVYSLI